MNNQKELILITGCSGRIGKATIDKFQDARYQIVGLDIVAPQFQAPNLEYLKCDLSSDESVDATMTEIKKKYGTTIASVIHLAAYYNFVGGAWELYEKITIQGTKRLLNACKKFQTEQFLFSSTMLVHAAQSPPNKISESSPLTMNWEYPKSKVLTEEVMQKEHDSIPIVILRIAGCYDDECHSIPISNQIQRIYERQFESRVFPGNVNHGAAFLHLEDLADCIFMCVQKRKMLPPESVFVVGEDVTLSYDQLQKRISKLLFDKEMKTYRIPKAVAKLGAAIQNKLPFMKKTFIKPWMIDIADANYILDISHIKKTIGWVPKHSIGDTLPIMIRDLKKDPKKWYQNNALEWPQGGSL